MSGANAWGYFTWTECVVAKPRAQSVVTKPGAEKEPTKSVSEYVVT